MFLPARSITPPLRYIECNFPPVNRKEKVYPRQQCGNLDDGRTVESLYLWKSSSIVEHASKFFQSVSPRDVTSFTSANTQILPLQRYLIPQKSNQLASAGIYLNPLNRLHNGRISYNVKPFLSNHSNYFWLLNRLRSRLISSEDRRATLLNLCDLFCKSLVNLASCGSSRVLSLRNRYYKRREEVYKSKVEEVAMRRS